MTAKTTRILKEARPLFWPWCAVVCAGALPLLHAPYPLREISGLGFLLGIPLLAALPFGNEFQNRTFSLLLSQPISRMEIWREKLSVTALAVLTAALVSFLSWRVSEVPQDQPSWGPLAAGIIAFTASATFWTLFTRSTIGGVVLNLGAYFFIFILWGQVWFWRGGYSKLSYATFISTLSAVFLLYAGIMLCLGWRKLARFQATGAAAGDDLLTTGPDVMPGALAGWLRSRPNGAVLNLIRKEFRLLRPVWLITLLATLGWICLALYGLMHEQGSIIPFTSPVPPAKWPTVVWIVGVPSTLIIAILAGSLSLGEEKTSGTHAWHMTLPVPAFRQWLIKLFMALFAGLMGAALLPISLLIAVGSLSGSPFRFVDVHFGIFWLLLVALLTFASFWCACAVNGTVRAVLWVFPAMIGLALASLFGEWTGGKLAHFFISRFGNLISANTLISSFENLLFSRFDSPATYLWWVYTHPALMLVLWLLWVPTLLLAVVQSYRLFRTPLQDRALSVVRSLLPLAMTAFLCTFSLLASYTFVNDATGPTRALMIGNAYAIEEIVRERAIEETRPGVAKLDATHPLQLTENDVENAFPRLFAYQESTRRWLRNARITVSPDESLPSCGETQRRSTWCYYSATIRLADGTDLTESYEPRDAKSPFGHYSICAHWPGAAGQETLWDR